MKRKVKVGEERCRGDLHGMTNRVEGELERRRRLLGTFVTDEADAFKVRVMMDTNTDNIVWYDVAKANQDNRWYYQGRTAEQIVDLFTNTYGACWAGKRNTLVDLSIRSDTEVSVTFLYGRTIVFRRELDPEQIEIAKRFFAERW